VPIGDSNYSITILPDPLFGADVIDDDYLELQTGMPNSGGGLPPGGITNADVSPTAAIDQTKIAGLATAIAQLFEGVNNAVDPAELAIALAQAINGHVAAADPHPLYATDADVASGLAGKANTGHGHDLSGLTGTMPFNRLTGQLADAQIPDAIARDSEVVGAVNAHLAAFDHAKFISEDATGKVPVGKLPDTVLGALRYQGVWAAATNSPAIAAASTTNKGQYYVVSGAVNQGHGYPNVPDRDLRAGDWLVSNGVSWDYIDSSDAVFSVNGLVGNVVLTPGLIGAQPASTNLDRYANLTLPNGSARLIAWNGTDIIATSGISTNFITSGVFADARIDSSITRDTEVPALARSSLSAAGNITYDSVTGVIGFTSTGLQPIDPDLTAIAALTGAGYAKRDSSGGWTLDTPSGGASTTLNSPYKLLALPFQGSVADSPLVIGQGLDTIDLSLRTASSSQNGVLSRADWAVFNGKQNALGFTPLNPANNLSDLAAPATARSNLGLGSAALAASSSFATAAQGTLAGTALQPGTAIANISGLQGAIDSKQGITADLTAILGAAAAAAIGQSVRKSSGGWEAFTPGAGGGGLQPGNNLSDLTNIATARSNLGLGSAALSASSDFATAAQGGLASTALQSGTAIGNISGLQTALDDKQSNLGFAPLNVANNFSEITGTNRATARTNLGLGTAAIAASTDFATAAQGSLAASALQPASIGISVQGFDSDLAAIAALATTSYGRNKLVLVDAAAERQALQGRDINYAATKPTTRSTGTTLVSGDQWFDTSNAWWAIWDGTRWITQQIFTSDAAFGAIASVAAATYAVSFGFPGSANFSISLLDCRMTITQTGVINATDHHTMNMGRITNPYSATIIGTTSTFNTAIASGVTNTSNANINLAAIVTAAQGLGFRAFLNKVGSASGTISSASAYLRYRLAYV
jgi:hypothetical protein